MGRDGIVLECNLWLTRSASSSAVKLNSDYSCAVVAQPIFSSFALQNMLVEFDGIGRR